MQSISGKNGANSSARPMADASSSIERHSSAGEPMSLFRYLQQGYRLLTAMGSSLVADLQFSNTGYARPRNSGNDQPAKLRLFSDSQDENQTPKSEPPASDAPQRKIAA